MEICRFLHLMCLIYICDSCQGLTDTWSQQPNKTACAYVVAVLLVCLQSLRADRLHHMFSKKHRPPKRCRRIKGRRYRHSRGRRGKQSRQCTGPNYWARSRKVRNRLAHTVNGNGAQRRTSPARDATASNPSTSVPMDIESNYPSCPNGWLDFRCPWARTCLDSMRSRRRFR